MSLRLDRNGTLSRIPASKRRNNRVLKRTTGVGRKRLRKLANIERKQRKRFNKLLRCPSCKRKAGSNDLCVVCAIKRERRSPDRMF